MRIRNTPETYGIVAIILHWTVAFTIIGLFALGLWMVELDYYSEWYKSAPHLHKSIGLTLLGIMLARLIWRLLNPTPGFESGMNNLAKKSAHFAHQALYGLIFLTMMAGYFISTADGRAIEVFNWFEVPAIISGIDQQEDIAGKIHFYLAVLLIAIASVHALAALKHHFYDRDNTLKKMLGRY